MEQSPVSSAASSLGSTPPPLERVEDAGTSLSSRLSPWFRRFSSSAAQWTRLATHGARLGVRIELCVDVTDSVLDEDDEFEHLLQLREAIDLVQLTLAVEPSALVKLLRNTPFDDASAAALHADAIDSVLTHGARTELRMRLTFRNISTRLLMPQLATHFIQRLGQTLSTNATFRELRRDLVERLHADHAAAEHVARLSVPITMDIDSDELETISLLDADDFFVHLASFSTELVANQRERPADHWPIDTHHVPLRVEKIELMLQRFCITHRVVQAAKTFVQAGLPVQLKRLNLDPRLISCADHDVRDFVATLAAGATRLAIDTGLDCNEDFNEAIDEDDQDRRATICSIFDAVANVEHLQEVNLGGILTLCVATLNRQEVWRCLFRKILSRAVVPETITMDDRAVLLEDDRACIREEAAHWRQTYPDKKLFIQNLRLGLVVTAVDDIEEILLALDDVESLELRSREGRNLPLGILSRVLTYPSLKKLSLGRLMVPSMDIFDPTLGDDTVGTKPVLEELELDDMMLEDVASMSRFVERLRWDSECPSVLAKSLRRFCVTQCNVGWVECYVADKAALESLARVLATNRVLCSVEMTVDYAYEFVAACEKRIVQHNRTALPALATTRQSAIAKARNLAFLSVIRDGTDGVTSAKRRLDAVVVSRILAFAAPHQLRIAKVQPWEDF